MGPPHHAPAGPFQGLLAELLAIERLGLRVLDESIAFAENAVIHPGHVGPVGGTVGSDERETADGSGHAMREEYPSRQGFQW